MVIAAVHGVGCISAITTPANGGMLETDNRSGLSAAPPARCTFVDGVKLVLRCL